MDRKFVIIAGFLLARNDNCENKSSAPSLSNEIYPKVTSTAETH